VAVRKASELKSLVSKAMARRCTKSTRINADSSRSHCCFAIRIEAVSPTGQARNGVLHLIDLAGACFVY
jgi:hypothetical protein